MTARRHYLVCYDVADDKRRNRIFQTLKDHGSHIQYSVFLCELSPSELAGLRGQLDEAAHKKEDQVLLVDLGPQQHDPPDRIDAIGRAFIPGTNALIV